MNMNVRTPLQRVLSSVLCVAMLLSVLVMPIGATGTDPSEPVVEETTEPEETVAETTVPEETEVPEETVIPEETEIPVEDIEIVTEDSVVLAAVPGNPTSAAQPDDLTTYTTPSIRINLFDYSEHINKIVVGQNADGSPKYAWNPLVQYFSFRGSSTARPAWDPNEKPAADADAYNVNSGPAMTPASKADGTLPQAAILQADGTYVYKDLVGLNTSGYNGSTDADGFVADHATVLPNLDKDGNPVLVLNKDIHGNNKKVAAANDLFPGVDTYSLAYLFDPSVDHHAVESYVAKNLPLVKDNTESFQYFYSGANNAVDYDKNEQIFRVRNYVERSSSTANYPGYYDFMPFTYTGGKAYRTSGNDYYSPVAYDASGALIANNGAPVPLKKGTTKGDYTVHEMDTNYWFGMTMEIDFYMTKDGKIVVNGKETDMVFDFSGDDDVWVFVDNVLVLDLGGTHGSVDGSINFATGEVKQYLSWNKTQSNPDNPAVADNWAKYVNEGGSLSADGVTYSPLKNSNGSLNADATSFPTTLKERFTAAGKDPVGGWDEDGITLADYTKHTLKFFYLERGSAVSNCKLDFSLPVLPDNSLTVTKELTVEGGTDTEAEIIQNTISYGFRVWQTDSDGNKLNKLFIKENTKFDILDSRLNKIGEGIVDESGIFYLKAGQSAQFLDMLKQADGHKTYLVEEILPTELRGQYGDVEYKVGDETKATVEDEYGNTADYNSFCSDKISAEASQAVTYRNNVVLSELGVLKITKQEKYANTVSVDTAFTMQVKLGGELLPVGTKYTIEGVAGEKEVTEAGKIELKLGQTAVIGGILAGTTFEVSEILGKDDKFNVTYAGTIYKMVNQDGVKVKTEVGPAVVSGTDVSGEFPLGGVVEVAVTNETVDFEVEIPIDKTAIGHSTGSAEFSFDITPVTKVNGNWEKSGDPRGATVTLNATSTGSTIAKIGYQSNTENGTKFYYKITENNKGGDFAYDTSFFIVEVTIKATNDGLGGSITNILKNGTEPVEDIRFVNQKLAYIIVYKDVAGIQTENAFAFTMTGNDDFALKDNDSRKITVNVGEVYKITENVNGTGYTPYVKVGDNGTYQQANTTTITATEGTMYVYFTNARYGADDTVVVDYGLPVEVDVLSNDGFPKDVTVVLKNAVEGKLTGKYGTATVTEDNKIRYEFNKDNSLTMDETEKFTYQVSYDPVNGSETTAVFEATLTIIPATTIYYEDGFLSMNLSTWDWVTNTDGTTTDTKREEHNWSQVAVENNNNNAVQDEDRPGLALSKVDHDNLYGYDNAYTNFATWSGGSAYKTTVSSNAVQNDRGYVANHGTYSIAEFTFKGTGFDVISMTSGETGTIKVKIFKKNEDGTGFAAKSFKNLMVDTYYGYSYNAETGEWVVNPGAMNELYQIPVIKVENLTWGEYKVEITASHDPFFDHNFNDTVGTHSYDFYLDAIRIYDPANDGADNEEIEDAYVSDGEGWPEYHELRNMIINANDFYSLADGEITEGIVFIDGNAKNESIKDYTNYGPNNEIYLASGQSIAFDMNFEGFYGAKEIARIQIGVKLAQGEPVAKLYGVQNVSPERQIIEDITPEEMIIDVNTATDLYYEITHLDGKTVVITNTGNGILSITNIKVTFTGKTIDDFIGDAGAAITVDAGTAEAALVLLGAGAFPNEPEVFTPEKLEVKLSKDTVKVDETVNVTVTTGADVAYITVNGQVITKYTSNRRTGERIWKASVTCNEAGAQEIAVVAYNGDSLAGEPAVNTVTVEAMTPTGSGSTGGWGGIFKGFFGGSFGGSLGKIFGGWFN